MHKISKDPLSEEEHRETIGDYVPLIILVAMVLIGIGLIFYFEIWE